jgi:hypothetical protein
MATHIIQTHTHYPLSVQQMVPSDPAIFDAISAWHITAHAIEKSVNDPCIKGRILNCQEICWRLRCGINSFEEIYVCKDSFKSIQAIMVLEKDPRNNDIVVCSLTTRPENIHSSTGQPKIKRAGTCLMREVFKQAVEQGKDIRLSPFPSAKSFYQRFGFVCVWDLVSKSEHMVIIADWARRLYPQYIRCIETSSSVTDK